MSKKELLDAHCKVLMASVWQVPGTGHWRKKAQSPPPLCAVVAMLPVSCPARLRQQEDRWWQFSYSLGRENVAFLDYLCLCPSRQTLWAIQMYSPVGALLDFGTCKPPEACSFARKTGRRKLEARVWFCEHELWEWVLFHYCYLAKHKIK